MTFSPENYRRTIKKKADLKHNGKRVEVILAKHLLVVLKLSSMKTCIGL